MLTAISYAINTGGPGPAPIDYNPQLRSILDRLVEVIGGIEGHEAATGERHSELKEKLTNLFDVGSAIQTLAQQNAATQEQIKGIIQQIADTMPTITAAIDGFKNASLDAITLMGDLIQREFDQTQAALANLEATVISAAQLKTRAVFEDRKWINAMDGAMRAIVPMGAIEVSGYPLNKTSAFVVNGKDYAVGEQYLHEATTVGNTALTYDEKTFEIPAGCMFQVSYKSIVDIGPITVLNGSGQPIVPPFVDPLDQVIEVPPEALDPIAGS
jgi:hypothetical protein